MTVDELVVKLSLDPSRFTKGQQEALSAYKKTQEELRKQGTETESGFKRLEGSAAAFRSQLLGIFALLAGGRGLKEFATYLTQTSTQVGMFSSRVETNTETLSQWRGAIRSMGGSADSITGTIKGLVHQFQMFSLTGESSVIPYFRSLGVEVADAQGKMRLFNDIFLDLASAVDRHPDKRGQIASILQQLGLDDHGIALILKGRAALEGVLETQRRLGQVTKEDAQAATELTAAWNEMSIAAEGLGRDIMTWLSPTLTGLMKTMAFAMSWWKTPEGVAQGDKQGVDLHNKLRARFGVPPGDTSVGMLGETIKTTPSALRAKVGAGSTTLGTLALARSLQSEIPGLDRFTAFDDAFHSGTASKHAKGLALDFTIKDKAQAAATAAAVRAKLTQMGVDATVLDEYTNPSARSTGGHIHVQFNSTEAAQRYIQQTSGARNPGGGGGGTTTNQVSIGQIVVNTAATDAAGIARDLKPAIENSAFSTQAQSGPE